jgi:hypothetical protein
MRRQPVSRDESAFISRADLRHLFAKGPALGVKLAVANKKHLLPRAYDIVCNSVAASLLVSGDI